MKKAAILSTVLILIIHIPVRPLGEESDTLAVFRISEVTIEKSRGSFFAEDKKISTPDSVTKEVFAGSDIGELLGLFTSAYINAHGGTGSSASSLLRGMGSHHTAVSWNGFTINSLTLGTTDLSLLPAGAFSNVSVIHGASGSIAGSGNMGGSVLLDNVADWNERIRAGVRTELGTYGSRNHSFSANAGNHRIQYQLRLFSNQAENRFRYTDTFKPGAPEETISNNALNAWGLIHNLYIRLPRKSKLEAGMWYQVREKEIPAIMGSYIPSNSVQSDSLLRVYAKWSLLMNRSLLTVSTAMFDEHMVYRDRNPGFDRHYLIDSHISSSRWLNDINYRIYPAGFLTVDAGASFSSLSARAGSYGNKVHEYQSAAFTAAKISLRGFVSNISLRKEFHGTTEIPLLFAIGIRKDLPFRGMALKAGYSDQFRVPSFNDKYWQPGGNPDLLPEYGYSADIGLAYDTGTLNGTWIRSGINAYRSALNNMISWVPSENSSWWHPVNREKADISGIEATISAEGRTGFSSFSTGLSYNYARSVANDPYGTAGRKRLAYVPEHTWSAYLNFRSGRFFTGINSRYSGSRFTTADNNPMFKMPSFTVLNGYAGYVIRIGGMQGRLQMLVRNMLNTGYQVVRSYPMPGRTFHLGLTLEFSHK